MEPKNSGTAIISYASYATGSCPQHEVLPGRLSTDDAQRPAPLPAVVAWDAKHIS